jgi:hypothetical protein
MKKINESQLAARVNGLRNYLAQLDEAGPYTAGQQAPAPTGNSFDAQLAKVKGTQPAAGARTGPVATKLAVPDPKGPGARPTGWMAKLRGDDARWDTANAAKYNPDGTAKKTAVASKPAVTASAQAAPAAPGTPAAATSVDAAKAAGSAMNTEPAAPAEKAADGGPAPTPEQLKWLGGANPNDPIILARMRAAVPDAPAVTASAQAAPAAAVPGVKAGGEVVDTRGGTTGQDEMEESVGYSEEQSLARIMQIANHRR